MIDLGHAINAVSKKVILENENPNKIVNIVEKFFDFDKQQKCKGIDILTHKQTFQRLPMVLAQVKADNTSENLLN